jgi:hypothetical protein
MDEGGKERKKVVKEEDAKEIVHAEFQGSVPVAAYKHNILKLTLTACRHTLNSGV